jgi:hypothetical protein
MMNEFDALMVVLFVFLLLVLINLFRIKYD